MPLRFEYACFISYAHAKEDLVRTFVEQFRAALASALDPLTDLPIYLDEKRLQPGYLYNDALASALCRSASMVVIYSPVYERRPYCGREFEAMARLEPRRLEMAQVARGRGLIVPVVLRGFEDLPPRIKDKWQAIDFSQFTLADRNLRRQRSFVEKVEAVAKEIYGHWKALEPIEGNACVECDAFVLPCDADIPPWRPAIAQTWPPQFPNR